MIDPASIERLKSLVDIVDVIGNYIELKKAGSNYKALCPFHDEKTPSFVVSPSRQRFHCFGCGVGGDVIQFVMEYEKLSYPEAIEKIATLYNFSLTYTKTPKERPLLQALEAIQQLYTDTLPNHPQAMDYLAGRGVSRNSIERFGLGFAPASPEQIAHLRKCNIPLQGAIEAGILAKGEGGEPYARIRDRITFPIHTPTGLLVGFGGRTLGTHPAKYLNTPQTKLFNKSKLLYGYHLAKETIYKERRLILCEGYLDVILLHQGGFTNAVATLGTALTPHHLPLLRKGEPQIILAYDGDRAGVAAAIKAAKLLAQADLDGGVVLFEPGADPADMVQQGRLQELEKLLRTPKPLIEFVLEESLKEFDLTNPKEKERALKEAITFLRGLSPILQEEYKEFLAALLQIHPAKIPLKPKDPLPPPTTTIADPKELSLIKTMLLFPQTIESVLDLIDVTHLRYHQEEFQAILEGNLDHPKLRSILLDETIIPFQPEELEEELTTFLIQFYERKIKEVAHAPLALEQKSFLIRRYRDWILQLKRGEVPIGDDTGLGTL
ncbi:MAG: DNA primase [Nitratiruptor sp.]|nr:DNA primase [Nitratiruptor sp.]NPA83608.1 DNA primase [Campylobacterota bacterium]